MFSNSLSKFRFSNFSSRLSDFVDNASKSSFVATAWRFSISPSWLLLRISISWCVGRLSNLSWITSVFSKIELRALLWAWCSSRILSMSSFWGNWATIFDTCSLISYASFSKDICSIDERIFEVNISLISSIMFFTVVSSSVNEFTFSSMLFTSFFIFADAISSWSFFVSWKIPAKASSSWVVFGSFSIFFVTSASVCLTSSVWVSKDSVLRLIFETSSFVEVSSSLLFIITAAAWSPSISFLSARFPIDDEISIVFSIIESKTPWAIFKFSLVATFAKAFSICASFSSIAFRTFTISLVAL